MDYINIADPLFQQPGMIKDKDPAESIAACTKDENPRVRGAAVRALGDIHVINFIQDVIELLNDQDQWVRRNAINSLAKIGNKEHLEYLEDLLNDNRKPVRLAAKKAIKSINNKTIGKTR